MKSFDVYSHLTYAFSTKQDGDMSQKAADGQDNRQRWLARVGIDQKQVVFARQVHGNKVMIVGKNHAADVIDDCDGLVGGSGDLFLAGVAADCVLALAFDPTTNIFGIAHAGWRGILAGIGTSLVDRLAEASGDKSSLLFGFGPSICQKHYQVQQDVADPFIKRFGQQVVIAKNNQMFLNLQKVLALQLQSTGIDPSQIKDFGVCTLGSNNYFSYRGGDQASFMAIIGRHQ